MLFVINRLGFKAKRLARPHWFVFWIFDDVSHFPIGGRPPPEHGLGLEPVMNPKMCMVAGENRTKTELSCGQVAEGDRSALRKDLLHAPAWIADLLLPLTETPSTT